MSIKGATSNHGMRTINRQEALQQEAEFKKDRGIRRISCPYCGEEFVMSKADYSLSEAHQVIDYFRIHKCPYCNPEVFREYMGATVKHEQTLLSGKVMIYTRLAKYPKSKCLSYDEQKNKGKFSYNAK